VTLIEHLFRSGRVLLVSYLCAFLTVGLFTQSTSAQQQQSKLNIAVMDFDARGGI